MSSKLKLFSYQNKEFQNKSKQKENEKEEEERQKRLSGLKCQLDDQLQELHRFKISTEMDIQQKEKELRTNRVTMDSQRKSILDLQIDNEKLNSELKDELEKNHSLIQKVETNRTLCSALKIHTEELEINISSNAEKYEKLSKEDEIRNLVVTELSEKYIKLKQLHNDKLIELKQECTGKLLELKQEMKISEEQLKNKVSTLEEECENYKNEVKELKNKNGHHLKELENMNREMKTLQDEWFSKFENEVHLHENLKSMYKEKEQGIETLEDDNKLLKDQIAEQCSTHETKLIELNELLDQKNESFQNEKLNNQKLMVKLETVNEENVQLLQTKETLEKTISSKEESISKSHHEIQEINIELDNMMKIKEEFELLKVKQMELVEKITNCENDNSNLREENEKLKTVIENNSSNNENELELYEQKIKEMHIEIENKNIKLEENEKSLKKELNLKDEKIKNLEQEKANEECDMKNQHSMEIAQMWELLRNKNSDYKEEINNKENKIEALYGSIDGKLQEIEQLNEKIKKMEKTELDYKNKIKQMKAELEPIPSPFADYMTPNSTGNIKSRNSNSNKIQSPSMISPRTPTNRRRSSPFAELTNEKKRACYTPKKSIIRLRSSPDSASKKKVNFEIFEQISSSSQSSITIESKMENRTKCKKKSTRSSSQSSKKSKTSNNKISKNGVQEVVKKDHKFFKSGRKQLYSKSQLPLSTSLKDGLDILDF